MSSVQTSMCSFLMTATVLLILFDWFLFSYVNIYKVLFKNTKNNVKEETTEQPKVFSADGEKAEKCFKKVFLNRPEDIRNVETWRQKLWFMWWKGPVSEACVLGAWLTLGGLQVPDPYGSRLRPGCDLLLRQAELDALHRRFVASEALRGNGAERQDTHFLFEAG